MEKENRLDIYGMGEILLVATYSSDLFRGYRRSLELFTKDKLLPIQFFLIFSYEGRLSSTNSELSKCFIFSLSWRKLVIRYIQLLWYDWSIFDCMNAWSVTEHIQKRNDKITLYSSINIEQFNWLFNVFLNYVDTWNLGIKKRGNSFSLNAQS